jgi:hypothetical protein
VGVTDDWTPFDDGAKDAAIGTEVAQGSESGVIVRDEEHALGARITLEKEAEVSRYAITCGIYGWMMHTCFLSEEGEAVRQYEAMKAGLGDLLERAEELVSNKEAQRALLVDGCAKFVERFP